MSTYQGFGGLFVFGGILDNTPLVNGTSASALATINIDGTSLQGVILTGDVFTVSSETGTPAHTVTSGPYTVANGSVTSVTFTPALVTGGATDNSTLAFTSNAVAQVRGWNLNVEMETYDKTCFGDKWQRFDGGLASFEGDCELLLDYADTKQAALIDRLVTASPQVLAAAFTFRVATSKQFYGSALFTVFDLGTPVNGLVTARCTFAGDDAARINWN